MHYRSDSRERSYQRKYNQDSSEPEEFFVLVFYSPKQRHHSDTHGKCRMIGRETAARHKLIQDGFVFEISQSQDDIRPRLVDKELDAYICDKTYRRTSYDI